MSAPIALNDRNKTSANYGICFCIAFCLIILTVHYCGAEVYSWTDDSGGVHFTDSAESIPKKYREHVQVSDLESSRSWEYLASEYGADFYYDSATVSYQNRNRFKVIIKESYARADREEYETQIILDCARQLYKPMNSVRINKKNRSPVDVRGGRDGFTSGEYMDGFRRYTHPYIVLSRMICSEKAP